MALFLDVHSSSGCDANTFVSEWSQRTDGSIRCLKHFAKADAIALLVEAPDEEELRASDPEAVEVTELFAHWQSVGLVRTRAKSSAPERRSGCRPDSDPKERTCGLL